eukprot:TRINITY_DN312_c1_g1_i1.p1 TRINITY_DN312_c1_g1~~TRINITY_DN312_c1_g1_i1.p1  ORF type:complete len:302 (-),score=54.40 TRINITY_DN312_c1_g1_i1:118-1023(-)
MSSEKELKDKLKLLEKELISACSYQKNQENELNVLRNKTKKSQESIMKLENKIEQISNEIDEQNVSLKKYENKRKELDENIDTLTNLTTQVCNDYLGILESFGMETKSVLKSITMDIDPPQVFVEDATYSTEGNLKKLVPTFNKTGTSNISEDISNGTWEICLINVGRGLVNKIYPAGPFEISLKIISLKKYNNSWGFQFGCIYSSKKPASGTWIGKNSNGIGYIALTGKCEYNGGSGRVYGAIYGVNDTIKMVAHPDHWIEFFKNGVSQGKCFKAAKWPVIPAISITSKVTCKLISYQPL